MSALRESLEEYLAIRRSLGFKLTSLARHLHNFVDYAEDENASYITTELALRWAQLPTRVQPATRAARLAFVRRFAAWRSATDRRTQVPPEGLLSHRYRRKPPYIYSDDEIGGIVLTAGELASPKGLRARTYSMLFGLLAVTGMRVSEALGLDRNDVDLEAAILTVRRTKFGKTRLVPVHPSTRDALRAYGQQRDQIVRVSLTAGFFVSERGTRITGCAARCTFAKVSREIGLRDPLEGQRHGHGPRLHDMRHRFAVRTLVDWYRAGLDVEREIPKLATYLGHVHVHDTYWYLEGVPELLALASERLLDEHEEVGS
ncbi:MAG: tyrosine-type recombinase/integrase [Longimicrobiales bacterium]|nr:tyrosine-type recombinase/integrase [Longimicrobiales bacterium]